MVATTDRQKSILLVEDESLIAMAEAQLLRQHGFDVLLASSGERAVEVSRSAPKLDLVLMDIDLGRGMDGAQAAEAILVGRSVPVVFLSSHAEPEIVAKVDRITSYGYIVKGCGDTVLVASIQMAFRLHQARQESQRQREETAAANGRLQATLEELQASHEELQAMFEELQATNVELVESQSRLVEREQALDKLNQQLRGILRYSPTLIAVFDLEGRYVLANEALAAVLGSTPAQVEGKAFSELLPPETAGAFQQRVQRLAQTLAPIEVEDVVGSEGQERAFTSTLFPIFDSQGRHYANGSIAIDITERKRAQRALAESEERYRAMFQNMTSGVAVYQAVGDGEDFIFKDFNAAAEQISKTSRDRVVGKRLLDLFPNMDRFGLFAALQRVYRTGSPEHLPATFYKDPYRQGWRENFIYRLPSGDVVAIYNDVTERQEAEIALREANERMEALFEGARDAILIADADSGLILGANAAASRLLAYPKAQLVGMHQEQLAPPGQADGHQLRFREYVEEGKHPLAEVDILAAGGRLVPVEVSNSLVRLGSGRYVVQGIFRDISERKQAERDRSRALEEKNALLRELQHRVKNTFAMITSLIRLKVTRTPGPAAREMLEDLGGRIMTLSYLFSMLYTSGEVRNIRLDRYLHNIARSLLAVHVVEGQCIDVQLGLDAVTLDVKRAAPLGLILNELLTNALKHAFPAGRCGTIEVTLSDLEHELVLEVADDGVGLAEGFDLTRPAGLGLELVRVLTSQLDGRLESERGEKTIFRVRMAVD
ncbi:MAG: PAS domain S-box protein [Thermoflexales bacterium]|nr:PAS domain S-box protein [Thermoflexales bacterium]